MSWDAPELRAVKNFADLRTRLAKSLPDLFRRARLYEYVAQLPYGPTVRPSGDTNQAQVIEVTTGTAFTVANPSEPREGVEITLDFHNLSEGSMGAVTFGSEYALAGAFEAPAEGAHALYTFVRMPD